MTRLIGHLVAVIERHSSQKLSLHLDAIQIKKMGKHARPVRRIGGQSKTCKIDLQITRGATMRDNKLYAGYSKSKSGWAEHSGKDSLELRRD